MDPVVVAQLGVEGNGSDATLASGHGMSIDLRQDLNVGTVLDYPRRANEHSS